MKLIKTLFVALSAILVISCGDLRNAETVSDLDTTSEPEILQQCLDSKMERWYKAFNRYQLEGYNMFAADLKALQEANAVYENCRHQNLDSGTQTALN